MTTFTVLQGNAWGTRVTLTMPADPAFVFTGIEIRAQLRSGPTTAAPLLHQFVVTTVLSDADKKCEFSLSLSAADTSDLPNCYGDFVLERDSPQFGPLNLFPYALTITRGVTS